jgi:Tfp pilus assembly protein PilN
MKRMNLLPPEVRPREGARRGSGYVVVGTLAAAVVAMLCYGYVISGVRSDESDLAALKDETDQAQATADALSPYGQFAEMKDRRAQSVRFVADTRFNYERLTRELARVLPEDVWVGHLDVAPAEPTAETVQAGADSAAGTTTLPPAMKVSGCAPSQDAVADTLDQLRALTGATDVSLGSSTRGNSQASATSGPRLVSGAGSAGCGQGSRPRVAFDATVTLTAPGAETTEIVPASASTTTPGAGL